MEELNRVKLKDIATVKRGITLKRHQPESQDFVASSEFGVLRYSSLSRDFRFEIYTDMIEVKPLSAIRKRDLLLPGDLLVSRVHVADVGIFKGFNLECVTESNMTWVRITQGIDLIPEYLAIQIRFGWKNQKGTTCQGIEDLEIVLPSTEVQQHVINQYFALLSQYDQAQKTLSDMKQGLENFSAEVFYGQKETN